MKNLKFLFALLMLVMAAMAAQGQGTTMVLHGVVIDKNGNPIAGAFIEAAGGVNSTETAADGTFSIEVSRWLTSLTASAVGMHPKTIKLDKKAGQELVFKLKEDSNYDPKNLKGEMELHGVIIDNNGNPISGAKVVVKDESYVTVSNSDGTFSFQIPRSTQYVWIIYPGLHTAIVKLHGRAESDMIVKLLKHDFVVSNGYTKANGW